MRWVRPRPRPGRTDAAGFALIAGGGCLTLIVVPLIFLAAVGFILMLAIGFAQDTQATATEAEGVFGGYALGVAAVVAVLFIVWLRALYGGVISTALIGCAGIAGIWFVARTWMGWESGLERPEDRDFLMYFVLFSIPPAALVLGAVLRLVARLRGGSTEPPHPPARRPGPPPVP